MSYFEPIHLTCTRTIRDSKRSTVTVTSVKQSELRLTNFCLQTYQPSPLLQFTKKLGKKAKNPCFGSQWEKAQQRNQDSRENTAGRRRNFSLHHQLYSFKLSTDNKLNLPPLLVTKFVCFVLGGFLGHSCLESLRSNRLNVSKRYPKY